MKIAIIENNTITNVIVISDDADPFDFGGIPLPDGKWIGDTIGPVQEPEPTAEDITLDLMAEHEERLCMLEITTGI